MSVLPKLIECKTLGIKCADREKVAFRCLKPKYLLRMLGLTPDEESNYLDLIQLFLKNISLKNGDGMSAMYATNFVHKWFAERCQVYHSDIS